MSELHAIDNMIKQQLLTNRIVDESIIDLFNEMPRENFFPEPLKTLAYADSRLALNDKEEALTPLEEATILQALNLKGDEVVLHVGTGCGYLTALLAKKAKKVFTLDTCEKTLEAAKDNLASQNIDNVTTICADGARGYMKEGPYDVIVLSGGLPEIGPHFKPQLMKGGKLFAFIGTPPALTATLMILDNKDNWHQTPLFDTNIQLLSKTPDTNEPFKF